MKRQTQPMMRTIRSREKSDGSSLVSLVGFVAVLGLVFLYGRVAAGVL